MTNERAVFDAMSAIAKTTRKIRSNLGRMYQTKKTIQAMMKAAIRSFFMINVYIFKITISYIGFLVNRVLDNK